MKKKAKLLEETKELFFNKGQLAGTRNELLDYVWNVQFKRQFGYSFSKNHTLPYSVICLQEMNLATKYPQIFWNTACLSINAGADEDNENNKTTNYGKVAKAISEIQKRGQIVALPHINKAKFGFSPDLETNEIIFSLKGIQNVGDDLAKKIIENQPYASLIDFVEKMNKAKENEKEFKCGNTSIISLIKAGCFDLLENKDRSEIMKEFIKTISKPLKSLGMDNIEELKMLGQLTPQQLGYEYRLHKFRKYVLDKRFFVEQEGKSINTGWYHIEEKFALPYFYTHFEGNMEEEKDYKYLDDGRLCVKRGSLDREFKKLITDFKENVIDSSKMLDIVNKYRFDLTWEDNAFGTISKWEMDSLSFYYHEHELAHVDRNYYTISDYDDLPSTPEVAEYYMWRGKEKPRFKLTRICGTVLDKDKNKHIVTLLTPSGVVLVKFYKGQFGFYDQQLSEIDEDTDKKTVIEKSWFSRGSKLLITGFRREDQFVPKNYSDSIYKHSVQLIRKIEDDGKLVLQNERAGKESEEI